MIRLLAFREDAVWIKKNNVQVRVAYMVLEYVSGGEFFYYLSSAGFKPTICRFYFKQML